MYKYLVFFYLCNCNFVASSCYWDTGCHYNFFSSAYNGKGDIRDSFLKIKHCEAISIWSITQHGRRNPSLDLGKKIKEAIKLRENIMESYKNGNSSLCAQNIENLREWTDNDDMFSRPSTLTKKGHQEMLEIGKRLRETFPKILETLKIGSYIFQSVSTQFVRDSLKAFVEGIAGGRNNFSKEIKTGDNDDVIGPHLLSKKYLKYVRNNPKSFEEAKKYEKSLEFLAVKERLKRRTGVNFNLTAENIISLYSLCRFTWSGLDKFSPWCALFTIEDLQVIDYISDLRTFYQNGYGNPMNKKLAVPALRNLLQSFQKAKNGGGHYITSYFGHATILDMIYTALGLFKDDIPINGSYKPVNRKWRTSFHGISTVNLLAVLNRCFNAGSTNFNVVFYLNEQILSSICNRGVCSWEEFVGMLVSALTNSDDESIWFVNVLYKINLSLGDYIF